MRKLLLFFVSLSVAIAASAQQLPDPGFEDWSGTKFAGEIQPKHWNYSNVSQLGVDKNFAHQTTGRSGKALKIQDQFVGVMGIGATSPGYVSLGKPWAHVSSLTSIDDATAGTHGGITWKHRPDSMVVWIKRYYDNGAEGANGDHVMEEDFNILYYAWSGTSKGISYKAKNGSCTKLSDSKPEYCVDEESDIRQALNRNECATETFAKQIAEGWICDRKVYSNWTRIIVPIYYLNDDVPQKCNVILSAGRYPDFRANTGQYAGSTMDVDDISLVYSSKIQKLYINGREWKAFDPNTTEEQTYSLGLGVTTIPEMYAVRGAGALTNSKKETVSFPGRRLSDTECKIVKGQVDGEPTVITVTAEDGKSTTVYKIKFVSRASDNAKLADLQVNGTTVNGFNAYLNTYNVALPYGTTTIPTVTATPQDANATVAITQPTSTTGKATILVTAADGTKLTYTIQFSLAALTDVTLQNIFVDGKPLTGFTPSKSNYTLSLPLGTTNAPAITWQSAYEEGVQKIELLSNTLENGAQIKVSLPDGTASKTYKIIYKIELSSYSYLADIKLDGVSLAGFEAEKFVYTIQLPLGTTKLPNITWTAGDEYQTIKLIEGGLEGVTRIDVTAANGETTTYRLNFRVEKSNNNALRSIILDGKILDGFHADTVNYNILLPIGTTNLPEVTWTVGDEYQKVTISVNQNTMIVRLTVTAGDGTTRVYVITFEVEKSANAFLQMIYLDGDSLEGFQPEKLDYSLEWTSPKIPKLTVLQNPGQKVTISMPSTYGTARIVVTPQEGAPNTYTVRFNEPDNVKLPEFPKDSFAVSNDASLAELYIDGLKYEAFKPEILEYTYQLSQGTKQVPSVVPVPAQNGQTITVEHGAVDRKTIIRVVAADGNTNKIYTINFPVTKSNNTQLLSVELEGVNFTFNPTQYAYQIALPYGTTQTPIFHVERAEQTQELVITEAPIGKTSTVEVKAEDGTSKTYTFDFTVAYPTLKNELSAIVVDGVGALDMKKGPDFTINFPYGTTTLDIVSITKNYPEQVVSVMNGGIYEPTVIIVESINPAEADKVYTITPNVINYPDYSLTSVMVDGVELPDFDPNVLTYIIPVTTTKPVLTYHHTGAAGVTATAVQDNNKYTQVEVIDEYSNTRYYTFYYYYKNDIIPNGDFTEYRKGLKDTMHTQMPVGWYGYADQYESFTGGFWKVDDPSKEIFKLKDGVLGISWGYWAALKSSAPIVLTLGNTDGFVYKVNGGSSASFSGGITFRNTPDAADITYQYVNDEALESKFSIVFTDNQGVEQTTDYITSTITSNYTTHRLALPNAGKIITKLNINIDATNGHKAGTDAGCWTKNYCGYGDVIYIDRIAFAYNSTLAALTVNDQPATISGNDVTVTLSDSECVLPSLAFTGEVPDQQQVVTWANKWNVSGANATRIATIENYAEDLSFTAYNLTVTRPASTNTNCTYSVDGKDLTVTKGSPFQKINVTTNDTAFVITVTAESGAKKTYYAAWEKEATQETKVTKIAAENTITGVSTARLKNLVTEPVLDYDREYPLDSVVMITTATQYTIHVYGTTSDTTSDTTYIINRNASSNALLSDLQINKQTVPDFDSKTFDYTVALTSLDDFSATPQDKNADVQYTMVTLDATHTAIFVLVTAEDGITTQKYSVMAKVRALAKEAYLVSILTDGEQIPGFKKDGLHYTISLPSGSSIPQVSAIACQGATVEMKTVQLTNEEGEKVTFMVTSEDGNAFKQYTLTIKILPSDVCTLDNIFLDGQQLEGFNADTFEYNVVLPYGTTKLPEVQYILSDTKSKATVNTNGQTVTIVVIAENERNTNTYTVNFTIAKCTNSYLKSIALDGKNIDNFYPTQFDYSIQLPYGASVPTITAVPEDTTATVVIDGTKITVTAEDTNYTSTYTLTFTFAKSTNAYLKSILFDGQQIDGFAQDKFDYKDTIPYGGEMPVVTWIVGDEQQQVDTVWNGNTQLTISVTAGDGVTTEEYILVFTHLLSSNCRLIDLQVKGVTVTGFAPDSIEYTITYPIGTDESELFGANDIFAVPEDSNATYTVAMDGTTAQIFVTAPDGTMGVYVIHQIILLSNEARLSMIWLDGVEVRDYNMDTLTYTITLVPGSVLPTITAQTVDTLAIWELGMETEVENGKNVEVFGIAEDGTILTYLLQFRYANWTATTDVDTDDYLFYYAGGGQYKAVTISVGVQIAVYDVAGRLQMIETVPVAHPADVVVEIDEKGNQKLVSALPSAEGVYFSPTTNQVLFYVFFDSKTKRVAKGGKFQLIQ